MAAGAWVPVVMLVGRWVLRRCHPMVAAVGRGVVIAVVVTGHGIWAAAHHLQHAHSVGADESDRQDAGQDQEGDVEVRGVVP